MDSDRGCGNHSRNGDWCPLSSYMTAAEHAKKLGFKSLKEVSELSGASTQNLNNWLDNKPDFFEIVLLGCLQKKQRLERNQAE